jgi:hypothetical protein
MRQYGLAIIALAVIDASIIFFFATPSISKWVLIAGQGAISLLALPMLAPDDIREEFGRPDVTVTSSYEYRRPSL